MATKNTIKRGTVEGKVQVTVTKNDETYDITGATITMFYQKPNGGTGTWAMTIDNGPRGVISYTSTLATDFDEAGTWKGEPMVVLGGGTFYGDTVKFKIEERLGG